MIAVKRGVYYAQPRGCWGCVHVGMTVLYVLTSRRWDYAVWRIEVLTPYHVWRWSTRRAQRAITEISNTL